MQSASIGRIVVPRPGCGWSWWRHLVDLEVVFPLPSCSPCVQRWRTGHPSGATLVWRLGTAKCISCQQLLSESLLAAQCHKPISARSWPSPLAWWKGSARQAAHQIVVVLANGNGLDFSSIGSQALAWCLAWLPLNQGNRASSPFIMAFGAIPVRIPTVRLRSGLLWFEASAHVITARSSMGTPGQQGKRSFWRSFTCRPARPTVSVLPLISSLRMNRHLPPKSAFQPDFFIAATTVSHHFRGECTNPYRSPWAPSEREDLVDLRRRKRPVQVVPKHRGLHLQATHQSAGTPKWHL